MRGTAPDQEDPAPAGDGHRSAGGGAANAVVRGGLTPADDARGNGFGVPVSIEILLDHEPIRQHHLALVRTAADL